MPSSPKRVIKIVEPVIDDDDVERVVSVLRSGMIAGGTSVVREFEEEFARSVGAEYAVAVANGTLALVAMLKAMGIGEGDEVIVPCFTFIATANAVLEAGAKPVFADIDAKTYTLDPGDVLEKITPKTKAVIAVHLYGHPAYMKELLDITSDAGIALLEDAAQAHGARAPEGAVGGIGDAAAFSFYATKNMTTGEGGMVTTSDEAVAYRLRMIVNHGQAAKYLHVDYGLNYRLSAINAALGLSQLKKLDALNNARRRNAEALTKRLQGTGLVTPVELEGYRHVYHQYVVRVKEDVVGISRDVLAEKLREAGIETAIHYPRPVVDQPFYRSLGYPPSRTICPNSLEASREVLSLPVHPRLTLEDINYIAESVRKILGY